MWADTTPEQRLEELAAMSAANDAMLERVDDARLERMWRLRALPADVVAILETLAGARR